VTFWGLDNARSWLRTWPAARPWEAPLPFDDDLQAAPAYWGVVDPSKLAARPADVLPPRLGGHDDVAVTATDRTGARVTFALPEAGDTRDGRLVPTCAPGSGTLFPVGTTTVTCTAVDAAGNTASRPTTFDVVVAAPVADLRAVVSGPATVSHNRTATYRVTVTNAGPSTAEGLAVVLGTTGLKKVDGGRGGATGTVSVGGTTLSGTRWAVPALASGTSVTFTVSGDVSAKKGGLVTAVAAATSGTTDPAVRDNVSRPVVTRVTK
jgi:endo-1,4-beta-xylanase